MRLTKKYLNSKELTIYTTSGANIIEVPDMIEGRKYSGVSINKLGQLEDVEEELGVNLITLFKALKQGIYARNQDNYIECYDNVNIGLIGIEIVNVDFLSCKIERVYKYDMYGKTWALTKEELE